MITEIKMQVTPDLSRRVQEIVGSKCHTKDATFLYIDKDKYITFGADAGIFNNHRFKEVSEYDFIASQGEQEWLPRYGEEVEFSDDGENWSKDKFSCYEPKSSIPYWADGVLYRHCRPLKQTKTITIGGKDTEISLEVYNKLVKQFIKN